MIINSGPANEAVLSNVGEIGEFRIRNSAKAFNILSSGLYANKIRAIIRELSCNAVDSHVAAGKQETPFDVHLPSSLEPWFSIRDYGTGLSHDQVTNIYTTYFESTKTESNAFIGALGLGSKSPFSYTDNFTVTAVKDGRKGIYSAFINAEGVPSIAQMMEEETSDPNGVEVKFSVNDRWDFDKFYSEARSVYRYFSLKPVVGGVTDFKIPEQTYETQDIIPGVSTLQNSHRGSIAIMGNISYPIDVPNPKENLDDLAQLLHCGLEMRFEIGELDFQASREGLSYIPSTIEAIKSKLQALNGQLTDIVTREADAIENLWDRATWLLNKERHPLWATAVTKYVTDTKFPLIDVTSYGTRYKEIKISVEDLAKDYNISIVAFTKNRGSVICSNYKAHNNQIKDPVTGTYTVVPEWVFPATPRAFFVVNDTTIGASERAKNHWRKSPPASNSHDNSVYVLSKVNKELDMKVDEFFAALHNPPTSRILNASELMVKERAVGTATAKDVTILSLQERGRGGYYRSKEMVWRDAGKADSFDANQTYYYLPLKGYEAQSEGVDIGDVKSFFEKINRSGIMYIDTLYGVRKTDIEFIQTQKNWVNIQTHLRKVFGNIKPEVINRVASKSVDCKSVFKYNAKLIAKIASADSPYVKFVSHFKDLVGESADRHSFVSLMKDYGKKTVDLDAVIAKLEAERSQVKARYSMLNNIRDYDVSTTDIADYINMIDSVKGI